MNPAPIVLFVYKRPAHTRQTLDALALNPEAKESVLYVFCDGLKLGETEESLQKIKDTRHLVRNENRFKEIIIKEHSVNKGLANSVIDGVTEVINSCGRAIVMEDDLITAKGFLKFMNEALVKYENTGKVMQITGFQFPAEGIEKQCTSFFLPFISSWGWASWKRAWDKFDTKAEGYKELKTSENLKVRFDLDNNYPYSNMLLAQMEHKNINSWAIRFYWSVFKNKGVVLAPDRSLVKNIGYGNDATHTKNTDSHLSGNFCDNYIINYFPEEIQVNERYYRMIKYYLGSRNAPSEKKSLFQRWLNLFYRQ